MSKAVVWLLVDILIVVLVWVSLPRVVYDLTPNLPHKSYNYCIYGSC